MPSKNGWTHDTDHEKVTLGRKQYRNMEEWSRPCAICGEKFAIFVRTNATDINASFGLRTCKDHRGQKIPNGVAVNAIDLDRLKALETEIAEIKAERDEYAEGIAEQMTRCGVLQRKHDALFAELQVVKAENATLRNKFAPYELQPAMERQAALPADAVGQQLLQKFKEKMPWEQKQ